MTRQLSDQELRLWLRVARTVRPTNPSSVLPAEPGHAGPAPGAAADVPRVGRTPAPRAEISKGRQSRPAEDHSRHRKIRRGKVEIDSTIDLHGHTQDSAMRSLAKFVQVERMNGARCVLVITGKGKAGTGVLRQRFLDWINQAEIRPHVSGYSVANARHGGDGAFYLLLKRAVKA